MNPLDKHIAELEDLIDLAEKVSNNIDVLVKRRNNILWILKGSLATLVGLVIFYVSYLDEGSLLNENLFSILKIGIILSIISSVFSFYNYKKKYPNINQKIKRESLILRRLLDMIHPFQESLSNLNVGIMRKAIIDMKLSRIKFSNIEDPKPTRQKEQTALQPKEPATTP